MKTTFTTQINEEHKGIEITFSSKPSKDIIDMLKGYGFRWHSVKKCWYAKHGNKADELISRLEGNTQAATPKTENKPINKYGVKVGDIFVADWGYEQTNINFYQVIALKGSTMVTLQEINRTSRSIGFCSSMVKPIPNSFKSEKTFTRKINNFGGEPSCKGPEDYMYLTPADVNEEYNATSYY